MVFYTPVDLVIFDALHDHGGLDISKLKCIVDEKMGIGGDVDSSLARLAKDYGEIVESDGVYSLRRVDPETQ